MRIFRTQHYCARSVGVNQSARRQSPCRCSLVNHFHCIVTTTTPSIVSWPPPAPFHINWIFCTHNLYAVIFLKKENKPTAAVDQSELWCVQFVDWLSFCLFQFPKRRSDNGEYSQQQWQLVHCHLTCCIVTVINHSFAATVRSSNWTG